jgi:hypothetical protein
VFASSFRTLAQLYDKREFEWLVTKLGLPIPETVLVIFDEELRDATDRLERCFAPGRLLARRGLLSDEYPLADALDIDEVHPTSASAWLVQSFVDGETVCSYSTVHAGRVSSHLMYRIPRQRKRGAGI